MDLSTTYLGLRLKNPLVASASPLSRTVDGIRQLEDAGAAAVVLFSLFEEQVTQEDRWAASIDASKGTRGYLDALRYYPSSAQYRVGTDEYLDLVSLAKRSLGIPVIGSLNGVSASRLDPLRTAHGTGGRGRCGTESLLICPPTRR
jgi:dihydroorotate dehydrogenase (fumarate)